MNPSICLSGLPPSPQISPQRKPLQATELLHHIIIIPNVEKKAYTVPASIHELSLFSFCFSLSAKLTHYSRIFLRWAQLTEVEFSLTYLHAQAWDEGMPQVRHHHEMPQESTMSLKSS